MQVPDTKQNPKPAATTLVDWLGFSFLSFLFSVLLRCSGVVYCSAVSLCTRYTENIIAQKRNSIQYEFPIGIYLLAFILLHVHAQCIYVFNLQFNGLN